MGVFDKKVDNETRQIIEQGKEQLFKQLNDERPKKSKEYYKKWLLENNELETKYVCLLYGLDGTGKSPLPLSLITDEDIKAGKRCVIIDLDGGNEPILLKYWKERCEKLGKKLSEVFIIKNPINFIVTEKGVEIDYLETFNNIKGTVDALHDEHKNLNIKMVVFDGLSTALKYAEYQMRIEKNINIDGGVNLRYWIARNQKFLEVIQSIKSLPVSTFFIAHEDFINTENGDDKLSSVKMEVNRMMHQKILCTKRQEGDKIIFSAKIHKSKFNVKADGKIFEYGIINNKSGDVEWTPEKVFKELL